MGKTFKQREEQPKRVLIGTPALDGRVDAWYCFALFEIAKLASQNNIDIQVVLLSYESILPMARNELLSVAIDDQFDCLVFLDSDVCCDPATLINIIKSDKDVVAIPTVKKNDEEQYDIYLKTQPKQNEDFIQASRVSTSCLKLSKKVLQALANNSVNIVFRNKQLYNICQYDFVGETFMGEDIYLCEKIKKLGFDIWLNIASTCMHIGPKVYKGNFKALVNNVNQIS